MCRQAVGGIFAQLERLGAGLFMHLTHSGGRGPSLTVFVAIASSLWLYRNHLSAGHRWTGPAGGPTSFAPSPSAARGFFGVEGIPETRRSGLRGMVAVHQGRERRRRARVQGYPFRSAGLGARVRGRREGVRRVGGGARGLGAGAVPKPPCRRRRRREASRAGCTASALPSRKVMIPAQPQGTRGGPTCTGRRCRRPSTCRPWRCGQGRRGRWLGSPHSTTTPRPTIRT